MIRPKKPKPYHSPSTCHDVKASLFLRSLSWKWYQGNNSQTQERHFYLSIAITIIVIIIIITIIIIIIIISIGSCYLPIQALAAVINTFFVKGFIYKLDVAYVPTYIFKSISYLRKTKHN